MTFTVHEKKPLVMKYKGKQVCIFKFILTRECRAFRIEFGLYKISEEKSRIAHSSILFKKYCFIVEMNFKREPVENEREWNLSIK